MEKIKFELFLKGVTTKDCDEMIDNLQEIKKQVAKYASEHKPFDATINVDKELFGTDDCLFIRIHLNREHSSEQVG